MSEHTRATSLAMGLSFLFVILFFCVLPKITQTTEDYCKAIKYREPATVFHMNTTQICKTNGAKLSHNVLNSDFGKIAISVHLNRTVTVGKYIFELDENCANTFHTRQTFVICADECNDTQHMFTPTCANVSFTILYSCFNLHFLCLGN